MRLLFVSLAGGLVLGAAACGGSSVPHGDVAVVDGTEVPRSALDEMIRREQRVYATNKRAFPKADSKDYRTIERNYVVALVLQAEFRREATKLGVAVSTTEVDGALQAFIDSSFGGDRTKFGTWLRDQGYTEASYRQTLRSTLLTRKVLAAVTKDVTVSDAEARAYYRANRAVKYPHSSFQQAKSSISAMLLEQKRADAKLAWIEKLPSIYKGKVAYAGGLKPPGA